MHSFKKIAALTASFVLGAASFTGCGSRTSTVETFDPPIITITITDAAAETEAASETEALTEAETTAEEVLTESEETSDEILTESEETSETVTEEEITEAVSEEGYPVVDDSYVAYYFRTKDQLNQHFEKHGAEFDGDFDYRTAEEYEAGASDVINNDEALFKYEKEDGDGVYYIEDTNEFVILSKDGYIRTYFRPTRGKKYFDQQ